ncbi:hypothetical protein QT397_21640 [Microbulbifer sp. MKSA007]|nr:hypothetical protein QT397_21640 [Microbulbifer sp. MKSA007]
MAYVDLNPVRANIAKTPEESNYTSIQQRIRVAVLGKQPKKLPPFIGDERLNTPKGLPFHLDHYLELVDPSGRDLDTRKRGYIAEKTPPVLERLDISPKHWLYLNRNFESYFKGLVGFVEAVQQTCAQFNKRWVHGSSQLRPANLLLPQVLDSAIIALVPKSSAPQNLTSHSQHLISFTCKPLRKCRQKGG